MPTAGFRIWPTFIRDGTPSRLSTISTGRAIGHVRHVFHRQNARDDALVTVTTGHLVARLQTALDGHIDLDHLLHAGAIRRPGSASCASLQRQCRSLCGSAQAFLELFELLGNVFVRHADVKPVMRVDPGQIVLWSPRALASFFGPPLANLADNQTLDAGKGIAFDDTHLVREIGR